jgi:hypothetical protein
MKSEKSINATKAARTDAIADKEALEMLKTSGLLKPDVSLDQMMKLSQQLNALGVPRAAFIFRDFLYRPCR